MAGTGSPSPFGRKPGRINHASRPKEPEGLCTKSPESRPRQWADCSSPFYNFEPKRGFNPANGSWADTSSPLLFILNPINRSDLNYPPTSVGRDSYFRSNLHIERT